jgi:hypothetical protein
MGAPWSAAFPVVYVGQSDQPKPLTLVLPYYDNPRFLRQQLAWWGTYPAHLRERLSVIVVDDGSPTAPAADVLAGEALPVALRLFRLEVDGRWNWLAARNIGAHHAAPGWVLLTDMDHVLPASTLDALVYGLHDPGVIYGFSRIEHTGEALAPHPNSWFLTREMFWSVGGYDETLSGHYGTDGDWRRRCAAAAPLQILEERLVRHEYVGDSSTTAYLRKQPQDAAVKRLVAARTRVKGWRPKTLSFPYHQVALDAVGAAR